MARVKGRQLVLVCACMALSLTLASRRACAQISAEGGLVTPEQGWTLSENLLENGDFSAGTTGWRFQTTCFSIDPTNPAPNGASSLMLANANVCSKWDPLATNSVTGQGGTTYTISGEMKTLDLTSTNINSGARFDLFFAGATPTLNGTNDWTSYTLPHLQVTPGTKSAFQLAAYQYPLPSGQAWFANLSMQQEIPPTLQTFLLYPNYRGLMFSDQSQVASIAITVNPPPGISPASYQVEIDATDVVGNIVASQTVTPEATEFIATLDMGALPPGTYQVAGKIEDASGNVVMTQSAYTIVKLDASIRSGMKAWIDPANLAHFIDGNAHFVLGTYDTTGYSSLPSAYDAELAAIAKAPINMVINYYIGAAAIPQVDAYTTAMKKYGITYMPTVNQYYTNMPGYPYGLAARLGATNQDQLISYYAAALAPDLGIVGYYVQDEPPIDRQAETFHQYSLIKANDPSGFDLAVLSRPAQYSYWRDTIDVAGVDSYPINQPTGNDLAKVADATRTTIQAVHGARPVWTVIQFFQATSKSAWPTEQQLHDMSWMAIVEGATGLFYWEYGIRGLYEVKDPVEHAALYQELINVTTEIKSLEPVLLSPDAPVITANSAAGTVFTKTKISADGSRYLFSYNYTASPVTAQFTLAGPATSVLDYDTGMTCAPDTSTAFYAEFQPYQAHIFLLGDSASATPAACATPSATASATATSTATATSVRTPVRTSTPTRTATATASATSTATATATITATPTVSATPTATATPAALSVSPAKLKFSAQRIGTISRPRTLKVTNDGAAAVKIATMAITGDFSQTNTCESRVPAHNSCSISVIFKRAASGKRLGRLTVSDNATNSPQVIDLTGR